MFSKTCEYAIRATIYIYNQQKTCNCNVGIDEIAENIESPRHFIAKILQTLSRQNIISSIKGPNGGFYMTAKQGKTNILDLVRVVDGPKLLTGCVLGLEQCNESHPCPMHAQYAPIKVKLLDLLQNNTIESLAARLDIDHTFLSTL